MPKLIADSCFGNPPPDGQVSFKSAHTCVLRCENDHYQDTGVWLFKRDQATAQAYEQEVEARGAAKALESGMLAIDSMPIAVVGNSAATEDQILDLLRGRVEAIRATSKKEGEWDENTSIK